jgi:hypothetical protein
VFQEQNGAGLRAGDHTGVDTLLLGPGRAVIDKP